MQIGIRGSFLSKVTLVKLIKIFPQFKLFQQLWMCLQYFLLCENLTLAIKLQDNKENSFEFYNIEVILDFFVIKVKRF